MLSLNRVAPVFHAVHARDEIEILLDAQVLPKAEPLRHVADLALDRFALRDHIVTEAGAAAGIGAQQPAEHADEGRLAAAVRAEKAVDLAGAHLQIDMIDDGAVAEALRHPAHVDGRVSSFLIA